MTHPQQPQQPPAWGAPPPQPPKKAPVGKIIGLGCGGLVILFILLAVVGALISNKDDAPKPPAVPAVTSPAASAPAPAPPAKSDTPLLGGADATGDVQLSDCTVDSVLKWPSVKVTITNKSSKSSNYVVQVEFVDAAGTRISEGVAAANSVASGQTAVQKAQGAAEATGQVTCKVLKVTRYAAG